MDFNSTEAKTQQRADSWNRPTLVEWDRRDAFETAHTKLDPSQNYELKEAAEHTNMEYENLYRTRVNIAFESFKTSRHCRSHHNAMGVFQPVQTKNRHA